MKIFKKIFLIIILPLIVSCSNGPKKVSVINEKSLDLQVLEAYEEGVKALEGGDVLFAAKKFNEVELLFPQSVWAPQSALMAAYSYYIQDYYIDAIAELTRFKKIYPQHKNLDYVHYLLAICYYEQIADEKKDIGSIMQAKTIFEYLVNRYPNTDYAIDAEFKLDLIYDILASKEMYVGRYYFEKKKWIPAINRFKFVLDEYDTTIYVEEAIYRLVEIYYHLGLTNESKKYTYLLGYNYQSSEWYEKSYSLFNDNYKNNKKVNKNKKNTLTKIKSLFD